MVNYKPHKSGYTLYPGKHIVNSVLDTLDYVLYRITQSEYFYGFYTGIKNELLQSLIIFLISFLLFVAFIGFIMLTTYFPIYLRMLWVRLLRLRNRLIINFVVKKELSTKEKNLEQMTL